MFAATGGELTQLSIKYRHGDIRLSRPFQDSIVSSNDEQGDKDSLLSSNDDQGYNPSTHASPAIFREATKTPAAAAGRYKFISGEGQSTTEWQSSWTTSTTTGRLNILEKVQNRYSTPPPTSSRSGRNHHHQGSIVHRDDIGGGRPATTGTICAGSRPFGGSLLAGALPSAHQSSYQNAAVARSHSAKLAGGGAGRCQQYQQKHRRLPAATDECDTVGRWDYASSEDYASAGASGFFNPGATAATDTSATVTSATTCSIDSASLTLASGGGFTSGGGMHDQQVRRERVQRSRRQWDGEHSSGSVDSSTDERVDHVFGLNYFNRMSTT